MKLFIKSEKQYNRTIKSLDALGIRSFLLGGYKSIQNYGIVVFFLTSVSYTDGDGSPSDYLANQVYTSRKAFIKAVTKRLQETTK